MYGNYFKLPPILLVIFLLSVFFEISCEDKAADKDNANPQDSIIIVDPAEFYGTYRGEYIRIKDFSSVGLHGYQQVEWTITDTKFWSRAINTGTVQPFACNFSGCYDVTSKINFRNVVISDPHCDRDDVTEGAFNMYSKTNQSGGDSLIFEQHDFVKDTYKIVRLVKTR